MPDLDSQFASHPIGLVVMWSGFLNQIPSGYILADGNNGTPDLIAFFLRGNPPSGVVGDITGEDQHILTSSEMPAHTHTTTGLGHKHKMTINSIPTSPVGEGSTGFGGNTGAGTFLFKSETDNASFSFIGNDQPHENRPPYYELVFIQKVSN